MKSAKIKPGKFIEITEDITPIPAGVYRLEQIIEGSYCFSVGRQASPGFMIAGDVKDRLKPITYREGKKRKTSCDDFLDRYYELLRNPQAPTICGGHLVTDSWMVDLVV